MQLPKNLTPILVAGVIAGGVILVISKNFAPSTGNRTVTVDVEVPELSPLAAAGKTAFDANCAQCHGANAAGTDKGPPLIHDIYNPGHHGDQSFFSAARAGVQQHHWPYGNMPAQPQVSDDDVLAIVRYVRELQIANGIKYRPHNM